jgi:hypothetical protein
MQTKEVAARLKSLREEVEQDGEAIADLETTFALALSDVCNALGLVKEEHDLVLGRRAAAYLAEVLSTRVSPVERATAGEMPVVAQTEVAVIPA